jgi:hypothetical protein
MQQALGSTGWKPAQANAILTGIKNKSPLMANGQGYSRTTKGYTELLTGGGSASDLDSYVNRLVKGSGLKDTAQNKAMIQSMLNQYALIAGKQA